MSAARGRLQRRLGEALFARVAGPQGPANRARFAAPGPRWFDADRPINRVNLGTKVIDGLETTGTRETAALPTDPNSHTSLENTKEFWYSKQLGLNLQVTRLDPMHGDQFFSVIDLKLGEPDARLFVLPATTKIVDLRTPPGSTKTAPTP